VELWLASLTLAPKSKAEIRASLGRLWDYAMWCGSVPVQRNPMSLVTVRGASKRLKKPRSLTAEEFQQFVVQLREPFRTAAVLCVSLGLRISECLALKWSDVDWLNGALLVERGIVAGRVDETKTEGSRHALTLAPEILAVLRAWKMSTQFGGADDWIFASPTQLGRLPWSYPRTWRMFQDAAGAAGLGAFGTHTLRHSYRSWLDAVGTTIAVQQKLMRHADIRTTMNVYGTVVTDEMATASGKVARLVVNGTGDGTEPSSSH
jgi:integrase